MNEDVFQKAIDLLPTVKADIIRRFPYELQGYIGLEMNKTSYSKTNDYPKNNTKVLNIRSGTLFRSFTKGNSLNLFKETTDGVTIGSMVKYAAIHEYGGTIKHPGSSKKQAFKIGGRLIVTNGTKAHDIPIPQRPYLKPAVQKFESERMSKLIFEIMQPLRDLFK
jgi:phage gpG-like protein